MAANYLHVGQTDLIVRFTWYEDLTGYTAKLFYRKEGATTETEKDATLTPGAESSVTEYIFAGVDATPFPTVGWYTFEFEVTGGGRARRCRPIRRYAHAKGSGAL